MNSKLNYIEHFGIIPENLLDSNNLIQLGTIQSFIYSLEKIINENINSYIIKQYAILLITKLKTIYSYRCNSVLDASKNSITESPYSILYKAREFINMQYNKIDTSKNIPQSSSLINIDENLKEEMKFHSLKTESLPFTKAPNKINNKYQKLKKVSNNIINIYENIRNNIKNIEDKVIKNKLIKLDKIKQNLKRLIIPVILSGITIGTAVSLITIITTTLILFIIGIIGLLYYLKTKYRRDYEEIGLINDEQSIIEYVKLYAPLINPLKKVLNRLKNKESELTYNYEEYEKILSWLEEDESNEESSEKLEVVIEKLKKSSEELEEEVRIFLRKSELYPRNIFNK